MIRSRPSVTRSLPARFSTRWLWARRSRYLGLPPWWLDEQATAYISGKDDPGKSRVFDHPGLRVMAASPEHVFAMKALAARTRDIDDLRVLANILGVESAHEALQICAEFYPDEPAPERSAAVPRELFG